MDSPRPIISRYFWNNWTDEGRNELASVEYVLASGLPTLRHSFFVVVYLLAFFLPPDCMFEISFFDL